ncbi:hypothetical protein Q7C36_004445 [Tachysurus vachellii]|uniref:Ig-like domain-containing protein n=1 Tax=Tachysurus vachellii TaxID=175792 RepID=A0AA88NM43_TACVA|nr:hypothetical protein Q7C36_004445 [Tachysurus vachellii]
MDEPESFSHDSSSLLSEDLLLCAVYYFKKKRVSTELKRIQQYAGPVIGQFGRQSFYEPLQEPIWCYWPERLQVFGPEEPLVAVVGEDLVLFCFIKPNTSAVDMTVEWFKLYVEDSLVHLYRDHKDKNEDQAQSYRGRTSLFKEELQKGNVSLKLSDLRVSDEGEYKCLVEDNSWYDDITVNVIVEAQGSHPVIMMESYDNSGGINLVCESRGWNPEPDVLWLDREGVTLTAEDTQTHRDTEGFSVKSRITVYDYSDSNSFYCKLQQHHHMMETEIIISSKVFDAWKWIVGISVSACLIAVGLIVTAIVCNYHKEEIKKEKQSTEHLQVFGPEEPLVAVVGEDLVLPCFIKPNTSVVDMTVEWFKLYVEDSLLHLYRDHKDKNEGQAQSYRGRTSLFKEELQKGNASLKLSDLRVSDEGEYKCLVEDKSWSDDITVNVIVEAQGSNPVITMESFDNSGGINLVCESSGWNPEPDVLWLDREGVTLTVEDTQIHRDTEGFSVKSHINVYDYSDSNSFYCKLQQQHHMLETEIIINSKCL